MPRVQLSLNINRDEYLKWYGALAHNVVATAMDGRKVQFPANVLQPFVSHLGVQGVFEIEFSDEGKFRSIQRLG